MTEQLITQADIDAALAEIQTAPCYDAEMHERFDDLVERFARQATETEIGVERGRDDWVRVSWESGLYWMDQTPAQISDLIAKLQAALKAPSATPPDELPTRAA